MLSHYHDANLYEQFDPTLLEDNQKPPCTEAILDPNLGEYHLLHNECQVEKSKTSQGPQAISES
jgi:hypothetical protein